MLKRRKISTPDEPVHDNDYVVPNHAQTLTIPHIKNKSKRAKVFEKVKRERSKQRKAYRRQVQQQAELSGFEIF